MDKRTDSILKQQSKLFTDFPTNFDKHPFSNDLAVISNEEAVKTSLKNIIKTSLGDRFFDDTIGSTVYKSLFDLSGIFMQEDIQNSINAAVKANEPRVNIQNIIVDSKPDNNFLNITIVFNMINNNNPITFNIILKRVR
jgi:phage baseplate assembly protein W